MYNIYRVIHAKNSGFLKESTATLHVSHGMYSSRIPIDNITHKAVKRPVLCFLGNSCIEYPSALEASQELNIPKGTINRASLTGTYRPIRKGHVFIYKDLHEVA